MSFFRTVLLATVVVTVFCGQAVAAPKPHRLGSTIAGVGSDGRRYVAFTPREDVLRVYDMRKRSAYSLTPPCPLRGGAYGRFLLVCDDGVRLLRARTRRIRVVSVPKKFGHTDWVELGRHWLRGSQDLGDLIDADFLNWRDGATVSGPEDMRADLDRRRFHEKPSFDLVDEYRGSSGGLDLYCRWRDDGRSYDLTTLELRRPGQSRPAVVLHRQRRSCAPSRVRHGVATWEASGFVHAYVLRTARTYRWRGSNPVHTRGWIAFLRATEPGAGAGECSTPACPVWADTDGPAHTTSERAANETGRAADASASLAGRVHATPGLRPREPPDGAADHRPASSRS